MPDYKYQHFVPCVYLKHFSIDGRDARRNSLIWRLNNEGSAEVTVESECGKDWHYTEEDAARRERMFCILETKYSYIPDRIWSGKRLSRKQEFRLLLTMFELHCRNPAYTNLTGMPNIHAYDALIHCLRILIGDDAKPITDRQLLDHLQSAWRIALLDTSCEPRLITSDNPALWFTFDETQDKQRLHFMLLPITPFCCAVAYDSRFVRLIESDFMEKDKVRLNWNQLKHCTHFIYGPSEPSSEEVTLCRAKWNQREPPSGEVTKTYCEINFLKLKEGTEFSFLSPV